jgi:hypothetical protein
MGTVRVRKRDLSAVGELLQAIGQGEHVAGDLRLNAMHWAGAIRRTMERSELQTVAWVLLEASEDKALPAPRRHNARYWAAKLEAHV